MSEPVYKDPGYNHAHTMKESVKPDTYAGLSLPYEAVSRIINILEDLHFQMQRPPQERFIDYPIHDFEAIDTFIRDNMVNLAISLETRAISEGSDV